MNTRASLYANEASKLLDTVSAYKTLYTEQLLRLFPPGKADTVRMLLRRLAKTTGCICQRMKPSHRPIRFFR